MGSGKTTKTASGERKVNTPKAGARGRGTTKKHVAAEATRSLGKPLNAVELQLNGRDRLFQLISLTKECETNKEFEVSKNHFPNRWDIDFFDEEHVMVKAELYSGITRSLTCVDCKTNRATKNLDAPLSGNSRQSKYICLQCTMYHFPGMMYAVCEQCYCNRIYPDDWEGRTEEEKEEAQGIVSDGHSVWFDEKLKAAREESKKKIKMR
jgi:hypothetical protein